MNRIDSDLASVQDLLRIEGTKDAREAARRCARRLLATVNSVEAISLPMDVETLASFARVRDVIPVDGLDVAGLVRPHPSAPESALLIETRASDSQERQRFTCAHEVAHTLMPGFWVNPSRSRSDKVTGQFPGNSPLEAVCDVAASELLLPETLVRPWLGGRRAGMEMVVELSAVADASLAACGRRMVDLSPMPIAYVTFSERLSKREQQQADWLAQQPTLPGFDEPATPTAKFRLDEFYGGTGFPYLPKHKSVESDAFGECLEAARPISGKLEMVFDDITRSFSISVLYAPMKLRGVLQSRFIALLMPPANG
jgi:IrrE N-terminal-like domain